MNYSYLKITLCTAQGGLRRRAARLRLAARHRVRSADCSRSASPPTARDDIALIGHSMGGLVARAALTHAAGKRVSQVIMLGTPNAGSLAAVQALRGTYSVVRKIAMLDLRHDAEFLARHVFASFPGLHELLPANNSVSDLDLFDATAWPAEGPRPGLRRCCALQPVSRRAWRRPTRASAWSSAATARRRPAWRCATATSSTNTACRATAPFRSSSRASPARATATWSAGTATCRCTTA